MMAVTLGPVKRAITLQERQLDFVDAERVFDSNRVTTFEDDRFAYGETRYIKAGWLDNRMVMIVWTPRGADRHVISIRHCHAKEERQLRKRFNDFGEA